MSWVETANFKKPSPFTNRRSLNIFCAHCVPGTTFHFLYWPSFCSVVYCLNLLTWMKNLFQRENIDTKQILSFSVTVLKATWVKLTLFHDSSGLLWWNNCKDVLLTRVRTYEVTTCNLSIRSCTVQSVDWLVFPTRTNVNVTSTSVCSCQRWSRLHSQAFPPFLFSSLPVSSVESDAVHQRALTDRWASVQTHQSVNKVLVSLHSYVFFPKSWRYSKDTIRGAHSLW